MGYSFIDVSLTYLRGLEISGLKIGGYAYGLKISFNQMPTEFEIEIIQ